jgi:anti-sigma B factor antagonist
METAIGVFASRERAEETVKELLSQRVPQDAIVFLTRSENEAMSLGKTLGAFAGGFVGGAAGLTTGVVAATLFLIPGIGQVFALGVGATAALGLAGAKTGAAMGKALSMDNDVPEPAPDEKCSEDLAFFGDVLKEGRSLIVVRTDWQEIAKVAAGILDRMGISAQARVSGRMHAVSRQIGGITVVDVQGRITVGEGNIMLREVVTTLMEEGKKRVLLNLREVEYIDSAGIGELVRTHTTLQRQGGQLKMVNLHQKVQDLLKATSLHKVFDVQKDEASAIQSFSAKAAEASG